MYFRYPARFATSLGMTNLRFCATVLVLVSGCVTDEPSDLDDAITEDEAGKADEVQAQIGRASCRERVSKQV